MSLVSSMMVLGLLGALPNPAAPIFETDWRAKADRILKLPGGSISLGRTSAGRLVRGKRMPLRGQGFALLPHIPSRKTRFGTDEMVHFLMRSAKRVRARVRHATLRIGNLGYRDGGRIPWSVSHRSGRDADIAFFMTNSRGRPVTLRDYVTVDSRGRSKDRRMLFDTRRNLHTVRALLEDRKVDVQWIFVSRHLKRKMITRARRLGWSQSLLRRMETVMKQPSDSAPHNDHFHVRIYCSRQDILHGCRNRGPFHAWVKPATEAYLARVELLKRLTRAPDARYRKQAVDKLLALHAQSAVATIIERLHDSNATVFKSAVQTLRQLMTGSHVEAVAATLGGQSSVTRIRAILSLMRRVGTREASRIALQVLAHPSSYLSEAILKSPRIGGVWLSALPLAARHGKRDAALALIDGFLPRIKRADVMESAHGALKRMTNHDMARRTRKVRALRSGDDRLVARWQRFAQNHRSETWRQWLRSGFEARGFRFDRRMWAPQSVPVLIRAARHRDSWINVNAVRVLNGIMGQSLSPDRRDRQWRSRFFRRLWKRQRSAPRSAKR